EPAGGPADRDGAAAADPECRAAARRRAERARRERTGVPLDEHATRRDDRHTAGAERPAHRDRPVVRRPAFARAVARRPPAARGSSGPDRTASADAAANVQRTARGFLAVRSLSACRLQFVPRLCLGTHCLRGSASPTRAGACCLATLITAGG